MIVKNKKFKGQHLAAFLLIIILSFSGLFAYFSLQEGHDWGGDFALYLRQTQSLFDGTSEELLEFNRYAMENSTEQMGSNPQIGPHLYPWGLPLLLAPVVAIWGFALTPLKVYMIIFFLLSLWVCYLLFLPRIGAAYSLLLIALLGMNPFLVTFQNTINSDIPFLFFSLLSLLFIEKSLGLRPYFVNRLTTFVLTGFLIFFSFLIRTNGIVLLAVLGLGQLIQFFQPLKERFSTVLKEEWKQLIPYGSFAAFWFIIKIILPSGSGSHLVFLQRLSPGKLVWNIMYYIELPADFYTGILLPDLDSGILFPLLLYGVTIPFLILGISRRIKVMPDILYITFCAASLLIFILWPPVQGLRFIFSLLPFYLYFVFIGLNIAEVELNPQTGRKRALSWVPVFAVCILGLFLFRNIMIVYEVNEEYPKRTMIEGPYTPQSQELFSYLRENSDKGDIIVFFKPRVLSFMTGHQAIRVTKLSEIREGKGDLLVYNKWIDYAQLPEEELQELQAGGYNPQFENEQFILINLKGSSNALPASR